MNLHFNISKTDCLIDTSSWEPHHAAVLAKSAGWMVSNNEGTPKLAPS